MASTLFGACLTDAKMNIVILWMLGPPVWIQCVLASIIFPLAYLFGYRAVYKRFSGEEW